LSTHITKMAKLPPLSTEDQNACIRAVQAGDRRAADKLVRHNARFVVQRIMRLRRWAHDSSVMEDFFSEGCMGLLKAATKFEEARKLKFISYAVWWIDAYVKNYIMKMHSIVKIGTTVTDRALFFMPKHVLEEIVKYEGDNLRGRAANKMISRTDLDLSLDAHLSDDLAGEGDTFLDTMVCSREGPEAMVSSARETIVAIRKVRGAIAKLPAQQRKMLRFRYFSDPPASLKEIGDAHGVTRERARQVILQALGALALRLGSKHTVKSIVKLLNVYSRMESPTAKEPSKKAS
jgi:RNA polymerase sigma-32 factor